MSIRFILLTLIILSTPGTIIAFLIYTFAPLILIILEPSALNFLTSLNIFMIFYCIGLLGWFSLIKLIIRPYNYLKKSIFIKIMLSIGILSNIYFVAQRNAHHLSDIILNCLLGSPIVFTLALIVYRIVQNSTFPAADPKQTAAGPPPAV